MGSLGRLYRSGNLEQWKLPVFDGGLPGWRFECARIKFWWGRLQIQATAGEVEALADQFGKMPQPGHPCAEAGVVDPLASQVVKYGHDACRFFRGVPVQPVAK